MAKGTWVWDEKTQKLIPKSEFYKERAHYIITDSMDPAAHPCTGKVMDSKSEFRKVTKAHGCVEVGNERMSDGRSGQAPGLKQDLINAINKNG